MPDNAATARRSTRRQKRVICLATIILTMSVGLAAAFPGTAANAAPPPLTDYPDYSASNSAPNGVTPPIRYGTDGKGSTQSAGCTTTAGSDFQSKIDSAAAGAVICVQPGDYSGSSMTVNKAVTVRAVRPSSPNAVAAKVKNIVISGSNATVDGFNLWRQLMKMSSRLVAELIGTAWLVLGGCGTAVLAAKFPEVGVGLVGVALAFGLTVVTGAYAFGHISGGHFNPAVTVGLWAGGRIPGSDVLPYIVAQIAGGVLGAGILYVIASGASGFDLAGGFASNGYAEHSPGGYGLTSALVCELVMTFMFLVVIMGATDARAPAGFAPLAIGLALTLIHLISIPVTNTSVNPARSMGPALMVGGWALQQLWLFWVAPLLGGALGGIAYRFISGARMSGRSDKQMPLAAE